MHEILLFSQISPARHEQVLNILAGVTGSQPYLYTDQILLFDKANAATTAPSKKKTTATAQQTNVAPSGIQRLSRSVEIHTDTPKATGPWRLRVDQTPDPAVKDATSRDVYDSDVPDANIFKDAQTYRYVGQEYFFGHRFVSRNVVVRIFRVGLLDPNHSATVDEQLDGPPQHLSALEILDASGTYLVEASVRLEDRKNTKIHQQAKEELDKFKMAVDGIIDFRVPDRLAFVPRV